MNKRERFSSISQLSDDTLNSINSHELLEDLLTAMEVEFRSGSIHGMEDDNPTPQPISKPKYGSLNKENTKPAQKKSATLQLPFRFSARSSPPSRSKILKTVEKRERSWEKIRRNFEEACLKRSKKIRRLVRQGIPLTYKGLMWSLFLNRKITPLYQPPILGMTSNEPKSKYESQIIKDVLRTCNHYATHSAYKRLTSLMVYDLLNNLSIIDKELGYTQGLNEVVGFMLSLMIHKDAMISLLVILNGYHYRLRGLYIDKFPLLVYFNEFLNKQTKRYINPLYKHLEKVGYPIDIIATKWFLCIYLQSLPIRVVERIWDLFILEGSHILICVALVLLIYHRKILLTMDMNDISLFFTEKTRIYTYDLDKFIDQVVELSKKLKKDKVLDEFYTKVDQISQILDVFEFETAKNILTPKAAIKTNMKVIDVSPTYN